MLTVFFEAERSPFLQVKLFLGHLKKISYWVYWKKIHLLSLFYSFLQTELFFLGNI